MKIPGGTGSNGYQMPEPGTYLARCIKSIDLGTQVGEFQGQPYSRRQVLIVWELPDELIEGGDYDGQPKTVGKWYTASLWKNANLHKDLLSWFPHKLTPERLEAEGFDTGQLVGISCQVTIGESQSGSRKVTAVTAPPRGVKVAPQVNPSVVLDLDAFDPDVFSGLSEKLQEKIAATVEYREAVNRGHKHDAAGLPVDPDGSEGYEDDLPF